MMSKRISILVAQDEKRIQTELKYNLKLNGFEVPLPEDGPVGLKLTQEKRPEPVY